MSFYFDPLTPGHYRVIETDFPWKFSAGTKRRPQHYRRMTDAEIMALPVRELAHPDGAWLFMWITSPKLPDAFKIAKAFGAKYSGRGFVWGKLHKRFGNGAQPLFYPRDGFHKSTGYTTRKNPEDCLLFKFGKPKRLSKNVPELIIAPLREHSRKPDEAYERMVEFAEGPRCCLFAREGRPGFEIWGDEADKFNEVPACPANR